MMAMNEKFVQGLRESQWNSLWNNVLLGAQILAHKTPGDPADLMAAVALRYRQQEIPTTQEEIYVRIMQAGMIDAINHCIAEANEMERSHPAAQKALSQAARELSEMPLPRTTSERNELLTIIGMFRTKLIGIARMYR